MSEMFAPVKMLRFRLYVAGELAHEQWAVNADDASRISRDQTAISDLATAAGQKWLVEAFNPDVPEATAYLRFGTDTGMMLHPCPLGPTVNVDTLYAPARGRP